MRTLCCILLSPLEETISIPVSNPNSGPRVYCLVCGSHYGCTKSTIASKTITHWTSKGGQGVNRCLGYKVEQAGGTGGQTPTTVLRDLAAAGLHVAKVTIFYVRRADMRQPPHHPQDRDYRDTGTNILAKCPNLWLSLSFWSPPLTTRRVGIVLASVGKARTLRRPMWSGSCGGWPTGTSAPPPLGEWELCVQWGPVIAGVGRPAPLNHPHYESENGADFLRKSNDPERSHRVRLSWGWPTGALEQHHIGVVRMVLSCFACLLACLCAYLLT